MGCGKANVRSEGQKVRTDQVFQYCGVSMFSHVSRATKKGTRTRLTKTFFSIASFATGAQLFSLPMSHGQSTTEEKNSASESSTPKSIPLPRHIAPGGIYFLLRSVSVPSEDGITGIRAGTRVKLVKESGSTVRVTDGHVEFEVEKWLVTNDLDVATAVIRQEVQSQQVISGYMRQQSQAADKIEADKNRALSQEDSLKKRVKELEVERDSQEEIIPGLRPQPTVNPLDRPAHH